MAAAEKKATERRVIEFARRAGFPLPDGELVEREEPDFQFNTNSESFGIELTHIHPPPRNKTFNSPLAEFALYERAIRLAEKKYTQMPGTLPVTVTVYPWDIEGKRGTAKAMVQELCEFVRANSHKAIPAATFENRSKLPRGLSVVSIVACSEPWYVGSAVTFTAGEICEEIRKRIKKKNERVALYREHMPTSHLWLLLYSGGAVLVFAVFYLRFLKSP